MISRIHLVLGLRATMQDPYVYVIFWAPISVSCIYTASWYAETTISQWIFKGILRDHAVRESPRQGVRNFVVEAAVGALLLASVLPGFAV